MKTILNTPKAKLIGKELSIHGDTRKDNYFWLNDREDKEVIDYLNEENAFFDEAMAHTKDFQKDLFEEKLFLIEEKQYYHKALKFRYWYFYYQIFLKTHK